MTTNREMRAAIDLAADQLFITTEEAETAKARYPDNLEPIQPEPDDQAPGGVE